MFRSRLATTGLLVVADGSVLVALWPDLPAQAHALTRPRQWLVDAGVDRVLATLAATGLWCAAAWVALGLVAAGLAHLPGAAGAVAGRVARRALPAALRRIVIGSAGLGVLLTPLAPLPAGAAPPDVPGGRPAVTAAPLPGPSWPGNGDGHERPATPLVPGPRWPGSAGPEHLPSVPKTPLSVPTPSTTPSGTTPTVAAPPAHNPPRATPPPTSTPSTPKTPRTRSTPTTATPGDRATVHAGDCLWLLAAQRVGPGGTDADVAAYLPQLYAANRAVIGDDPDLVRPGQVLALPNPVSDPRESS